MKTSDYLIPIPESTQELFLRRIRKKLTKRRWDYIMFYYGLDGNKPLTNIEIARRFNVSRQAVSIGLIRALETIREPSNMILLFPEYEEYVKTLQQAKDSFNYLALDHVRKLLGHKYLETTFQIYIGVIDSMSDLREQINENFSPFNGMSSGKNKLGVS